MNLTRRLFLIALASAPFSPLFAQQKNPNVLLANNYRAGMAITEFLISEKYDGVRAVWDGTSLHTRAGRVINAPA